MKKRKILTIKDKKQLNLKNFILYEPYKNITSKLYEIATAQIELNFDPVSKIFSGVERADIQIRHLYEALLTITSYYQHSQGGKGKLIERLLIANSDKATLNLKFSEIPLWIEYPYLFYKKSIFSYTNLDNQEKKILRNPDYLYLSDIDEVSDIGNFIDNELILMEIKNRIDSGGTAARREIWNKKFYTLINLINKQIFKLNNSTYSLVDILTSQKINQLGVYLAILFNLNGKPAKLSDDKTQGFYVTTKQGIKDFAEHLKRLNLNFKFTSDLEIQIKIKKLKINFGVIYGNEIPKTLLKKQLSITKLLTIQYDDLWLFLLTAILEYANYLKFGNNFLLTFENLKKKDKQIRDIFENVIKSAGKTTYLEKLVEILTKKYSKLFPKYYLPTDLDYNQYLADIILFSASYYN